MEMNKRFYKVLLSKYSVFIILSCIFSFVYNEQSSDVLVYGNKNHVESPDNVNSLQIEDLSEYDIERINSDDESIMLIGTLDGNIHAFDSNNNSEKWKINLGNPLVSSYIDNKNFLDAQFLFPGPDGFLYYSNSKDNTFQKLDIPLKSLIEKSPYTLPNMPNYLFIGNRITNVFIIDISNGVIVSKVTNNNEEDIIHRRSARSNNLATIIRIDYTLKSINREKGDQMWNTTVSEIMVIEKGSKHELTYNPSLEKSKSSSFQENLLTYQMKKHFSNEKFNSIVNVYKFKNDAPYKIYDNNNTRDNNFIDFVDNHISPKYFSQVLDLYNDFYKWKKNKMRNFKFSLLKKNLDETIEIIDKIPLNPNIIIFFLIVFIFILMIFTIKTYIKKQLLKNELKRRNKSGNSSNDSSSTDNTSKEKEELKEESKNLLVPAVQGYVKITNLEGDYFAKPEMGENTCLNDELNHGLHTIGNIFIHNNNKPVVNYNWENADKTEFSKTERSTFTIEKNKLKVSLIKEDTQIIEGAESIGKKMEIEVKEDNDNYIITKDITSKYRKKLILKENCLPNGNTINKKDSANTPQNNKTRTLSIETMEINSVNRLTGLKSYKEDENNPNFSNNVREIKKNYKKNRSCSPVAKTNRNYFNFSKKIPKDNESAYSSDYSNDGKNEYKIDDLQLNIEETEIIKPNSKYPILKIDEKNKTSRLKKLKNNINLSNKVSNEYELVYTSDISYNENNENNIDDSKIKKESTRNKNKNSNYHQNKNEEKFYKDNLVIINKTDSKSSKYEYSLLEAENNLASLDDKFKFELIKNREEIKSRKSSNSKKPENSKKSNNSKSINNLISYESVSNNYLRSKLDNKLFKIMANIDSNKKDQKSHLENSSIGIKSPYPKAEVDNNERLDNGRLVKDFNLYDVLGKGGFGCVKKAKHKLDQSYYAIKEIELEVGVNEYLKELSVMKEVKTMLKLQHKNVVRYYNCWFEMKNGTELKENEYNRKRLKSSIRLKSGEPSNLSETVDIISKSVNSSNLGIIIEKDKAIKKDDNMDNEDVIEEEPQEIFSDSEDLDNKKMFSIDYEKNMSEEEKKLSFDDSKINSKKAKKERKFTVKFYMQMEYCGNETLHQFLENRDKNLDRKTIFSLFKQIALGVAHIHKNGIIHRDLKPANIFMIGNNKINLKIGDFGLAADVKESKSKNREISRQIVFNSQTSLNNEFSVKLSENVGTPLYQSPEQIKNSPYNEKVDIYSLGLILLEICSFFRTYHERKLCLENIREKNIIPEKIKDTYILESQLIMQMTSSSPKDRPTVLNLLKSDAFRQLEEEFDSSHKIK